MTGSLELRRYLASRRDGTPREAAAAEAGISIEEARLTDAAEERGELAEIQPPPPIGHNSKETSMSDIIAADQLRLFIERVERLEEEKKAIADDIRDIYAEAKANGYDPKIMRIIVRERKMEKNARDEREALLDTYRHALGMLADTPLGNAALRAVA